jgi:hypothetical protein
VKKATREAYGTLLNAVRDRLLDDLIATIPRGAIRKLFTGEPLSPPASPNPSEYERYWADWLFEFGEVDAAMQHLRQATAYLAKYPGRRYFRKWSEADWIRYHFEVYLQGVYILQERLQHFLKRARKAAIAGRSKRGMGVIDRLMVVVADSLASVSRTRGSHVHVRRYDDDALYRLDGLVLFTKATIMRPLLPVKTLHYKNLLAERQKLLRRNNKGAMEICAHVFSLATPVIESVEPARPATWKVLKT